jgi:predicted DNA-binding transcriptional regulator YafY
MRRADRLFQIVNHLRSRRLTTAAQLSALLQVSDRTIYRDIRDLSLSGVPVEGEAGVGYRLAKTFDLPPIMFTFDELEAVVAGARMIESWGGPALASAAQAAIAKIMLAVPAARRSEFDRIRLYAPKFGIEANLVDLVKPIHDAVVSRHKIRFRYVDSAQRGSERTVHPLGIYFWGRTWTVASWCETRQDFRTFRLDRIQDFAALDNVFPDEPGRTLEDFLRKIRALPQT